VAHVSLDTLVSAETGHVVDVRRLDPFEQTEIVQD
jgi:hypothetical protein